MRIGKSASMSATLTTTLLPRPGVSTSHKEPARILEVIPPWSLSNKDARGTTTTKKTKTSKLVVAFDHEEYKENGKGTVSTSTPPPRGLRIREGGKENTHGRSTMQTSSCTSLSKPCKTTSSKIPVGEAKAKGALFSALSPIKHTRPLRVGSPTTPSTPTSGLSLSSLMRPRKISLQGGGKRRTSVSSALIFSPPTPTTTANGSGSEKENIFSVHVSGGKGKPGRKPMGPRQPSANGSPRSSLLTNSRMNGEEGRPRVRSSRKEKENKSGVSRTRKKVVNAATSGTASSASGFRSDSVRDRMREWERERERIREMERLEEKTREVDEEREREQEEAEMAAREAERRRVAEADIVPDDAPDDAVVVEREGVDSVRPTPLSPLIEGKCLTDETEEEYSRESTSLSMLKQSLKMSISTGIDGAVRLYKSSTLALGRSNVDPGETESRRTVSEQASWEDDVLVGHDVLVGDDVVAGQGASWKHSSAWQPLILRWQTSS